jgi:hypothetical protein
MLKLLILQQNENTKRSNCEVEYVFNRRQRLHLTNHKTEKLLRCYQEVWFQPNQATGKTIR